MARIYGLNNVRVTSTTGGTGAAQIAGTATGYLDPFAAGGEAGRAYTWLRSSLDGLRWEVYLGTLTAGSPSTISRDQVYRNSSGNGSALNWSAGEATEITCVSAAEVLALLDSDGRLLLLNMPLTVNLQAADWNGNFQLGTAPTEFVAIGAPTGARLLEIEASARLESGSTTASTVTLLARVYNAADDTVVAEYTLGQATLHASNARYVSFSGRADHTFAAPIPQQQIVRWLAQIDQAVSPISIYQLRGKIRAHLQA